VKAWTQAFFDAPMGGLLFDAAAWKAAPREVGGLLKLTRLRRGAILDAACGAGRHALDFARRGFEVTGVDATALYLREARQRAQRARLQARFERAELSDLKAYRGCFDLVTNLFTSFGYETTAARNEAVLRQMAACLKPGGQLALELLPRETLDAWFREKDWEQRPDGSYVLQERRWLDGGRRLSATVTWLRRGRATVRQSVIFVYSREELAALFRRAGLSGIKAYGGYDGRPFEGDSRLLMIGRKA
jgi:SAM-dependent methyltransferase